MTYWADGFDWRAREAELYALPHHRAVIAGRALHFLHIPAVRPAGAPAPLPGFLYSELPDRPLTPAEQAFIAAEEAYDHTDGGYSAIMGTRPDTIAAALVDSPVGLAAWIIDKFRDWTDGDLDGRVDRDTLLTAITLYWVTGSIGSSFRQYFDWEHNTARPDITVPAAFTLSAEPVMAGFPREIAERCCTNIQVWHTPGRGGHFMPLEEPDLLAADMTAFFTALHRP